MTDNITIIGGGLGGLSAGAFLSRKGHAITLIEQQPHVGGYAIAFKRDEFIFDVALHALPAGGPGQPFRNLIERLGLQEEVRFIHFKEAFLVHLGDYQFQIPNDYDSFFNKLTLEFPDEEAGIQKLNRFLSNNAPVFFDVVNGDAGLLRIAGRFAPKIPKFLKLSQMSTAAFLNRFVHNPKCKAILYQASIFFGQPMREFPAINFIIMFYLLFTTGMYTIRGGGQALTNALQKSILDHGGNIICGKQVAKIETTGKSAQSIILSDGTTQSANVIISNINTPTLVRKLIGESFFDPAYLESLRQLSPSIAILQLHLGLDCPVRQFGINQHIRVFFPDEDIDVSIERQNDALDVEGFSVLAPGITDPNPHSNNDRILSIVGGVSAQKWLSLSPEAYRKMKDRITRSLIDQLNRLFPGIRAHIKTIDLATPHTFRRYTQNTNGAILGYKTEPGMHRTLLKISRFPIKNIFLANAWTSNLGGFMQCIKSGIEAGEKALKYLNKL